MAEGINIEKFRRASTKEFLENVYEEAIAETCPEEPNKEEVKNEEIQAKPN